MINNQYISMKMKNNHILIALLVLIAQVLILAEAAKLGNSCRNCFGPYCYDLGLLSNATKGIEVSTNDTSGNTYYYKPCHNISNPQCSTPANHSLSVCQKDTRTTPQYHNLGSNLQVQWQQRSGGPSTGFILLFSGGEDGRKTSIEFVCNSSSGVGTLQASTPTESPTLYYHLKWASAYACPKKWASPLQENSTLCCYYATFNGPNKALCMDKGSTCPTIIGAYHRDGNSTVSSCSKCQPKPVSNTCCVYEAASYQFTSSCLNKDGMCPNQTGKKLVYQYLVDSCNQCSFKG